MLYNIVLSTSVWCPP